MNHAHHPRAHWRLLAAGALTLAGLSCSDGDSTSSATTADTQPTATTTTVVTPDTTPPQTSTPALSAPASPSVPAVSTTSTSTSISTTTTSTSLPLDDGQLAFTVKGYPTIIVDAPPPWEPFADWGMSRDGDNAEWIGLSFWSVLRVAAEPCQWRDSFTLPGESVAELADAFSAVEALAPTEPVPVSVGGADGLYLEWRLPSDLDFATCDAENAVAWTATGGGTMRRHEYPDQFHRLWILDVDGQRLVIDAMFLPREQTIIRERIDDVIESIQFVGSGD